MAYYIDPAPNPSGAYPGGKGQPFPGCIPLTDKQAATFKQYNGFVTITEEADEAGAISYTVMPNTEAWEDWKAKQPDPLEESKNQRIAQSKTDLADYLESHPLQWTDGEYYSITAEKQQQLTSKLFSAYIKKSSGVSYELTWNSTGEVCKEWTIEDLSPLAFAIETRVTALVSYQQHQEVAMRNAATQEELDAIVVDYGSVEVSA